MSIAACSRVAALSPVPILWRFLMFFNSCKYKTWKTGSYKTRNGTERNGTVSNWCTIWTWTPDTRCVNISSARYGELILRPVPATKTGQAPSRQYRATPSVLNLLAVYLVSSSGVTDPSLTSEGWRCHYRLWAQLWGVDLLVAHPGTGSEWYRFLYFSQIRNKHHHRASAFMLTSGKLGQLLIQPWDFTGISIIYSSVY